MCGTFDNLLLKAEKWENATEIMTSELDYALDQTCYWRIVGTKLAFNAGAAVVLKIWDLKNVKAYILQGENRKTAVLMHENLVEDNAYKVPLSDLDTYLVVVPTKNELSSEKGKARFNYFVDETAELGDFRKIPKNIVTNNTKWPTIILIVGILVILTVLFILFFFKRVKELIKSKLLKQNSGDKYKTNDPDISNEKF